MLDFLLEDRIGQTSSIKSQANTDTTPRVTSSGNLGISDTIVIHIAQSVSLLPRKPNKTPEQIDEEDIEMGTTEILSGLRRENRLRKFGDSEGRRALGMPGCVIPLPKNALEATQYMSELSKYGALIFPPEEFNGSLPVVAPAMFFRIVDTYDPTNLSEHGYGEFVKNTIDLKQGPTRQIRQNPAGSFPYTSRNEAWADLRPVELTYGTDKVVKLLAKSTGRFAELENGKTVLLTQTEVDRANAQRPAGQTWIPA